MMTVPIWAALRRLDMADDKKQVGKPDRDRISLSEPYEVEYWTKKFGVTKAQLEAAVKAVGSSAEKVKAKLGK
jgi:hypothetical protein